MFPARVYSAVRILAAATLVALAIPAGAVTSGAGMGGQAVAATSTPVQVYGAWHCGNDYCTWGAVRDMTEFDRANHWLIDRDAGPTVGRPSVNVVVLSFVNPLKLLNKTNDATTVNGVPKGMTIDVVNYFKRPGVRIMLSIGGITYTDAWDQALNTNATQLGLNAADVATALGVGIEIDYEQNTNPNVARLQAFIDAFRSQHPNDETGSDPTARLSIDLAAGDRWLIALTRKATTDWLSTTHSVLDYANAMVPARQPRSAAEAISNWQEHIDGKKQYAPPIPPLAPAKFTGGLYVALGTKVLPECNSFASSLQSSTLGFVRTAEAKVPGATPGMLGYMFWAAENPATRGIGTTLPNTCEGGIGAGATALTITIPMPALRQN